MLIIILLTFCFMLDLFNIYCIFIDLYRLRVGLKLGPSLIRSTVTYMEAFGISTV